MERGAESTDPVGGPSPEGRGHETAAAQLRVVEGTEVLCVQLESVDSTNLYARRLWEERLVQGKPAVPVAVRAQRQSGGMGRGGRAWESPLGGLWLSLAWPQRHELSAYSCVPLVAGLAVRGALDELGVCETLIKWPNDLLRDERKLCGLLCQSAPVAGSPMLILGVGINVNFESGVLGPGLRTPAITVREIVGHDIALDLLEGAVLRHLVQSLLRYEFHGWDARFMADLGHHLAWIGEQVECTDLFGSVLARGVLLGVDGRGHLVVDTPDEVRRVAAGEVTLRLGRG
jgi:BirA family transcriptional regulator, biotin operon repressor / biotin---[acetyl-CoA-carboxylase] ligase